MQQNYSSPKPAQNQQNSQQKQSASQPKIQASAPKRERLSGFAYYIFLITLVLTPLAFLPTPYISVDLVKTVVIVFGVLLSAMLYSVAIFKEKKASLPPKAIFFTAILLCLAAVISSLISIQAMKSLFGQGFETGTSGFLIVLFIAAWVAFETVRREPKRAMTIYSALGIIFALFFVVHGIRSFSSSTTLSFGILSNKTDTLIGKWNELSIFAIAILIAASSAISLMQLTRRSKIIYYVVGALALLTALMINSAVAWIGVIVAFAVMAVGPYASSNASEKKGFARIIARISWIPAALLAISIAALFWGSYIAKPFINKTQTQSAELTLPWQMSLDVISGSIKNYPLFGVGPNHFSQAFMTYKPQGFNNLDVWPVEFSSAFGLLPTYFVTMGSVGIVLWILMLVFLGMIVTNAFRTPIADPYKKFLMASSAGILVFLVLISLIYVPSHFILLLTFVFGGIFMASCFASGISIPYSIVATGNRSTKIAFQIIWVALLTVCVIGLIVYGKKTVGMSYFAAGVKQISQKQDYDASLADFHKALSFDKSDVYWQAISESDRLKATQLISTATSSSQALATAISNTISDGVQASNSAIAYDHSNYYNMYSLARILQVGVVLKIPNAYDNAVKAYSNAISINPQNPALYVNLAQLQASNNNLDLALQTLGAALQVKSNYLDAVFLLSQVHAARGDLNNAIIAAQMAIQLQPSNPLLFFQLGILEYNNQNYSIAEQALTKAVQLQPNYANAKYFLGLAAARNNDIATAVAQFDDLSKSNPDSQEVAAILNNLRAGKSPFATQTASSQPSTAPDKKLTLPLKEKRN